MAIFKKKPAAILNLEKIIGRKIKKVKEYDLRESITYFIDSEENITGLNFYNASIDDLSPLATFTKLKELYLWKNQVQDISPLA